MPYDVAVLDHGYDQDFNLTSFPISDGNKETLLSWFREFISLEDEDGTYRNGSKVLQFITGNRELNKKKKITIGLTRLSILPKQINTEQDGLDASCLPIVSTCGKSITFPIDIIESMKKDDTEIIKRQWFQMMASDINAERTVEALLLLEAYRKKIKRKNPSIPP